MDMHTAYAYYAFMDAYTHRRVGFCEYTPVWKSINLNPCKVYEPFALTLMFLALVRVFLIPTLDSNCHEKVFSLFKQIDVHPSHLHPDVHNIASLLPGLEILASISSTSLR